MQDSLTTGRHARRCLAGRRCTLLLASLLLGLGAAACRDTTADSPPTPTPGQVLWRVPGHGWLIVPSYDSSRVYFGTMDHRLLALDRRTGAVRWEAKTGNGPGGSTAGKNSVVVGDVVVLGDVDLYAFNCATGALRWVFSPSDLDETGTHHLGADSSTIYASSLYGRVYAIDARSGTPRWVTQLPGGAERTITFDPVEHAGIIFVGVAHETHPITGGLAALDAATGRILWIHDFVPRSPEFDSDSWGGVVTYDSLVIASAADGQVYGLDQTTGAPRWIAPPVPGFPYSDPRGLALAGSTVVTSSMSGMGLGLDAATGAVRWSTRVSGASLSRNVATDGRIALFSTSEVVALDVTSGAIVWRTGAGKEGGGYFGEPAIDGPRVYANRQDGFVALRAR